MDNPEPDPRASSAQGQPRRKRSLLNRAAVKTFILATVRQRRPGWRCERVSGAALDELEAWVTTRINEIARNPGQVCAAAMPAAQLLVRGAVRRMLLDRLRQELPWLRIAGLASDDALGYLEDQLRRRIVCLVSGHPTIGKTFKP